ncbi:MAG: hypothetical protein BWK80_30075 [Desulfobacteraceae bacterium IS3]|nr:MAG: hypothetical protein BWK80_30075 [Desulfobacteraceae bacterium IS3]
MKNTTILLIFSMLVLSAGCRLSGIPFFCRWQTFSDFAICKDLVPFSDGIMGKIADRLNEVQFYTSEEMILTREASESEAGIIDGRIRRLYIKDNRTVIEIRIPKYTPCVFHSEDRDRNILYVQCEPPDDSSNERVIPFVRNAQYGYLPDDMKSYLYEFRDKKINYDGNIYLVSFHEISVSVNEKDSSVYVSGADETSDEHCIKKTCYPVLLVDLVQECFREKNRRVVPGKWVGEQERSLPEK